MNKTDYPEHVTLDGVAAASAHSFVDGPFGSNLKSSEYVDSGVRLVQLQNIGKGNWINDNEKFISRRKFTTLKRHGAIPGDIAIAKMADPVARACILPQVSDEFIVVADCIRLRPDCRNYDPRYVAHAINSAESQREAERKSSGTTRLRINLSVLKTVHIFSPPIDEQHLIADILDTLDTTIRKTEALIAKLKLVKQGLLHDLLTRGVDENGELRDPERHPEQFKDSELGRIPVNWKVAPVTDFEPEGRSVLKTGPFGSSLKQEHWVDDGVSVITIGSLGGTCLACLAACRSL